MRIWIDLSNSPHPLLFAPIARRLEELGHEVGVTARDNAQTVELTLERWPDATIIGGQSPKSRLQKIKVMVDRIRTLERWARSFQADVALSHNSYGQIVAARMLGLPVVTAMDYEGQPANHLAFRLAHSILMPEVVPLEAVRRQGATLRKLCRYRGLKEEVYLGDFQPAPGVLRSIGVASNSKPLVVIRTPPNRAVYHRFGNPLFEEVIDMLAHNTSVTCVALVRHPEQRDAVRAIGGTNLLIPEHVVDSRSLMYRADLVIGAGGTMTREAALMGVPTYSIFAGAQPAADLWLESRNQMSRLVTPEQLVPIVPRAEPPVPLDALRSKAAELTAAFVGATLDLAHAHNRHVTFRHDGPTNEPGHTGVHLY